ncbi:MAG: Eco57I restriction-modification methylase domain-containing protein [Anaerolineae bacterium]|nr:Eco57I restriction-modification methylase domain-containing protein [Anaerolineae bacterium]
MTTPDQMNLLTARHLNQGLFSDYYLDDVVPTLPDWNQDGAAYQQMVALRASLRELLDRLKPETLDEAQLEELWVKPVLEALGHHWSVQVKIRYRDKGFRKPDYVFTRTQAEAEALSNAIYDPAQIAHTLAVGDAKRWGAKLDQSSGNERNPSQQIDEYLRYSERPWGILTDGRIWRLYHRESSKDNAYYAVDLPALLTSRDDRANEHFGYFLFFFRQAAFTPDGWLEKILKGSVDYAEGLSDALEEEVYLALQLIAQGFLDYRRNRLKPEPATLRQIYEQSLVLLYRLLFILYAESRDVLPLSENRLYRDNQSLYAIARRVKDLLERPTDLARAVDTGSIYTALNDLFYIIDVGSPQYEIAPYNGRLFSAEEHPFLADKNVGDAFLAPAVDKLTRIASKTRTRDRVFVDYRDLDVRHLGAIYERLLEYELDQAATPLTLKEGKYAPAAAGAKVVVESGALYLRTGNNERKITGSYYTPDYIVRFIVERTLEPLLTDITARHADLDSEGHWLIRDAAALRAAVLGINVLDPATGSGHFMVEAVAYIAEWLRRLALHPADLSADEDELVYWKRQVVTNCIYGVDVNPLAVELAKLSLWLTTLAKGRPLSFLDHHVRPGNTLVGELAPPLQPSSARERGPGGEASASAANGASAGGEVLAAAVTQMSAIETTVARVVGDVKGQEQSWADLQTALEPLRRAADAATAAFFAPPLQPSEARETRQRLGGEASAGQGGEVLAAQHRFFHWGLTFPEVFFNPDGTPQAEAGFDAVIGNPPYVRQQTISAYKPYLAANYQIFHNSADLFLYFFERAFTLLKPGHRMGFITSGTYMNSSGTANFRKYIHENYGFEAVINFGENQPFKGAEMVYPTISILRKDKALPTFKSMFLEDVYRRESLGDAIKSLPMVDTSSEVTGLAEWRFQSLELTRLFRNIMSSATALDEAVSGQIFYGILTGFNEAFYVDSQTRDRLIREDGSSTDLIKSMVRGQDLRPWYQKFEDTYLIFSRQGTEIDKYPAIKRHLETYRERLEVKPGDWDENANGKWAGRTSGNYTWFEWHDTVAYYREFQKPKIFGPDIGKLPRFSWNETEVYCNDKGFIIIPPNVSFLALLNSRVVWFALSQIATPLRLRAGLWQYQSKIQFIKRLPIPALTAAQESTLGALAEEITALAGSRYRLHESARHRISADLGAQGAGGKFNKVLYKWWDLPDLAAFRAEVKKSFKAEVPVKERGDWESWLTDQQAQHRALTDQIIDREARLNAVVYQAFELLPDEIALVERATKYPYGAV